MEPHENMCFWNQVSLEGLVVEMGDEGPGQRDMESRSLKHMQILRSSRPWQKHTALAVGPQSSYLTSLYLSFILFSDAG